MVKIELPKGEEIEISEVQAKYLVLLALTGTGAERDQLKQAIVELGWAPASKALAELKRIQRQLADLGVWGGRHSFARDGYPANNLFRLNRQLWAYFKTVWPGYDRFFPLLDHNGNFRDLHRFYFALHYYCFTKNEEALKDLLSGIPFRISYMMRVGYSGGHVFDQYPIEHFTYLVSQLPTEAFFLLSKCWLIGQLHKFEAALTKVVLDRLKQIAAGHPCSGNFDVVSYFTGWLILRGEFTLAQSLARQTGVDQTLEKFLADLAQGEFKAEQYQQLFADLVGAQPKAMRSEVLISLPVILFMLPFGCYVPPESKLRNKLPLLHENIRENSLGYVPEQWPNDLWKFQFWQSKTLNEINLDEEQLLPPRVVEDLESQDLDSVLKLMALLVIKAQASYPMDFDAIGELVKPFYNLLKRRGFTWLANQLAYVDALAFNRQIAAKSALKFPSIWKVNLPDKWYLLLNQLDRMMPEKGEAVALAKGVAEERMIWVLDVRSDGQFELQSYVQKITKNGDWSKGRKITAPKFVEDTTLPLTSFEKKIRKRGIKVIHDDRWSYRDTVGFDEKAVKYLCGHPLVFVEQKGGRFSVSLSERRIEVSLTEIGDDQLKLSMRPAMSAEGVRLVKAGLGRYEVVEVSETEAELGKVLGHDGVVIPKSELDQFKPYFNLLRQRLNFHADTEATENEEHVGLGPIVAKVGVNPVVRLSPIGEDIAAELVVKCVEVPNERFIPGKGEAVVFGTDEKGQSIKMERDLKAEKSQLKALLKLCPLLKAGKNSDDEWLFTDLEEKLELLAELREVKDQFPVEWPEGETLKFGGSLGMDAMELRISSQNDWFAVEGDFSIDEEQRLSLQALLGAEKRVGRFIQLEDGRFIALQKKLAAKLRKMDGFLHKNRKQMQIHPAAMSGFDQLLDETGVETGEAWKAQIAKQQAVAKKRFQVPKGLNAELRPYQLEGYRWLCRLAELGFGACLADDMGLGKTVQALALLLKRKSEGPALVVAPASVCENWAREAARFTPDLTVKTLGDGDRETMVKEAKAGELIICSFGLLSNETELLHSRSWGTVVLDEAHMIKNHQTKRTQTAFGLQAGFKLAATGTPLENHLIELWSLFEFLNPGLLGSKHYFFNQFVKPIQSGDAPWVMENLKNLVQPFILRRRKTEVLTDLPPKTEITLQVPLDDTYRAFYETLREDSLARIEQAGDQAQFEILAQLTRLRQACCHPKLVAEKSKLKSPKLELLLELLTELKENGHRALVFSQFVGFLKLVEPMLKKAGFSYLYLDGSTQKKKRQGLVDQFQNGEGDLFLISLKAGGTGLNLTAADYVIHLDPWWNPAVEDQASDRAHRIGQQNPVTVYRLVTENSVEDKIIAMHAVKRDLAEGLLAGADQSGKMSVEEMMKLIRGEEA